jgi:hypothetical protein
MATNAAGLEICTIAMCLLFGTNALLFFMLHVIRSSNHRKQQQTVSDEEDKTKKAITKELSKPFVGTFDCFYNLTGELWRTGLILLLTYVCERHWPFGHSAKHYDRDLFMFVVLVFFLYGLYTVKPTHDLALLGREQTEEWKGWMQFIFLLYHYFHAEEVYNSVRVMITCYVWMTGFGNFSFFFVSQDFGWLRVVHMLWRLNFAVLLLMWTHGNTYILYYICPMHTFYFFMVYATMYVFSSVNSSKWGIRLKLIAVGVIIYLLWDVNQGLFDKVFAFLGTDSVIGAGRGSVWEWYFRTSLDHWSSFLGMIFAVNFPLAEQYFVRAQGYPLYVAAALMFALLVWWYKSIYSLEKMEYNMVHSYTAIVPLLAYIFFRNMTPTIRSYVSMSLHDLGKTTLETYLLQHHIWLSSNAKTLLTIVPEHPWVNFAVCSVLFFYASKELYRLTMCLRGMLLPDNHHQAFQNIVAIIVAMSINFALAWVLNGLLCGWYHIALACVSLFVAVLFVISRFARKTSDNLAYQTWSGRFTAGSLLMAAGLLFLVLTNSVPLAPFATTAVFPATQLTVSSALPIQINSALPTFQGSSIECQANIYRGAWEHTPCPEPLSSSINKAAHCETEQWRWASTPIPSYEGKNSDCPIGKISSSKARNAFKNKRVIFAGDTIIRQVFVEFVKLLDPKFKLSAVLSPRQGDISAAIPASNTNVTFVWAPFVANLTTLVRSLPSTSGTEPGFIVIGAGAWDALYVKNLGAYTEALNGLEKVFTAKSLVGGGLANAVLLWLQPTHIVDRLLNSPEKQRHMTENTVASYRSAVSSSSLAKYINARGLVLNTTLVSQPVSDDSVDGVHYNHVVYAVLAQMAANSFTLRFPQYYVPVPFGTVKPGTPKPTGSMSYPLYGAYVLLISVIMLVTMDSFFGFGWLSLAIFGKTLDWEVAYAPFLKKLRNNQAGHQASSSSPSPVGSAGAGMGQDNTGSGLRMSSPTANMATSSAAPLLTLRADNESHDV